MNDLTCQLCAKPFRAARSNKKWCSNYCAQRAGRIRRHEHKGSTEQGGLCGRCGTHFDIVPPSTNRRYCSVACSIEAARELRRIWARREYKKRRPLYEAKRQGKDSIVSRVRRRYPDLPAACEACGEARIVELAHKPEHKRNGAWRTVANMQRHMVWVLCPTCHKLLDKHICSPAELGLA